MAQPLPETPPGAPNAPANTRTRRILLTAVVVVVWLVALYILTVLVFNFAAIVGAGGRLW